MIDVYFKEQYPQLDHVPWPQSRCGCSIAPSSITDMPHVFWDCAVEIVDDVKGSAPDALAGDPGKPTLRQVQPREPVGAKFRW